MSEPTDDRWARLAQWLAPHLGATGDVQLTGISEPAGIGYSAETLVFTANFSTADGERSRPLVLRAETPDPPVYPTQAPGLLVEIEIQRRLMTAVARAPDVPVAPILAAEADGAVIGAPFFIMEFIEGLVPAVSPSYTEAGFFVEATPDQRRRLVANGVRTLAAVHALDWKAAGLEWLIPPGAAPTLARQLDIWDAYARRELGERHHPDIQRAFDVLSRHLPAGSAPSLCWGDPRPGNIIWQDFQCASVTDWEAAAIAPPELDVGWWLMFDRESHEVIDVPRLDGEPTREEQRQLYAEASGRPLGDTHLYELFAAYRYAAIVVRVMNRAVDRGHMPADHTVWLENPAVTGLQQLLDS